MWTPSSTRSATSPPLRNRTAVTLVILLLGMAEGSAPQSATAQMAVFDPKNYAESILHYARELDSLSNQAKMLLNQAHALAASPYSHLIQTNQTLQEIAALAQAVQGIGANVSQVESQFQSLYPTAVQGADPGHLLQQAQSRADAARQTAQDLARTAAELERLSQGRDGRVAGALGAAQSAEGPTAAVQASAQLLAAISEDIGSLRSATLAQSRLMAEEAASRSADATANAELHRRLWAHEASMPPNPVFDPFPHAKN